MRVLILCLFIILLVGCTTRYQVPAGVVSGSNLSEMYEKCKTICAEQICDFVSLIHGECVETKPKYPKATPGLDMCVDGECQCSC
jgi:hypothetical protein